ncbi:helix-turn-helix domain-containing protein [Paenibacillus sp. FSL H8-0034]|uniref:helix-turn-helix domain-containing protein n=1 Tax=Paenibacillus sp. FSL H8-0034 TaxID=2954671 RepID=UPI0030F572FC
MELLSFSDFVKQARTAQKISSRDLSTKLGKAITYISQIEKGKIKTFDYATCYKILEFLNYDLNKIDSILAEFRIIAPLKDMPYVQFNFVSPSMKVEDASTEAVKNLQWLVYGELMEIKSKNATLHETFNILIERDVTRANTILTNLVALTKDKDNFSFFCKLFLTNLSTLDKESKNQIINLISQLKGEN